MKINFCGDSFCADLGDLSWVSLTANALNAKIIGTGVQGSCHEIAIESFNTSADATVFTWTHHSRLHNKHKYPMNYNSTIRGTFDSVPDNLEWKAGAAFYKYLYEDSYFIKRQHRDLYWFDHEVLSQYKKPVVHLWCFNINYNFVNGVVLDVTLRNKFNYAQNGFLNHISPHDNKNLSNLVLKLIQTQL